MLSGINYMDGTGYASAFSRFSTDSLNRISVRFYWNTIENVQDVYNTTQLNTYKNLLTLANQYNLSVNVTFWTQFQTGAEDPTWIKSRSGYTPYFKATDPFTKAQWIEWVEYMVTQLKDYPAVDSWSILNEPFYASGGQSAFESLMTDMVSAITAIDTSHTIGCRFSSSYTPASGKYNDSMYNLFDWMGITIYNHPDQYYLSSSRTDPTVYNSKWWMYDDTISDCASRSLPVWVIEFGAAANNAGYTSLTQEQQAQHYKDALKIFSEDGVDYAYAWAWRHNSPALEDFNLWTGSGVKLAYYELLDYVTSTPTPPPPPPIPPPVQQTYQVTIQTSTGGYSYPPAGTYTRDTDDNFSAFAIAYTDYTFTNWLRDGIIATTNRSITIDGSANEVYTIKPTFTAVPSAPADPEPPTPEPEEPEPDPTPDTDPTEPAPPPPLPQTEIVAINSPLFNSLFRTLEKTQTPSFETVFRTLTKTRTPTFDELWRMYS